MTESEWLSCTDPAAMFLLLRDSGGATERKLRLFACACCRLVWHLLGDVRSREAVEVAERFGDGHATQGQLDAAREAASAAWNAAWAAAGEADWDAARDAAWVACAAASDAAASAASASSAAWDVDPGTRADLFRDIFNAWLPALTPSLLAWHDALIPRLAQAAYDERFLPSGHLDPQRLAVLSDALEEAGCTDAALLEHLRGEGPHWRGCWAVDAVLRKE